MFIKSFVAHHIKSMKTVEVFLLESYVCKISYNSKLREQLLENRCKSTI